MIDSLLETTGWKPTPPIKYRWVCHGPLSTSFIKVAVLGSLLPQLAIMEEAWWCQFKQLMLFARLLWEECRCFRPLDRNWFKRIYQSGTRTHDAFREVVAKSTLFQNQMTSWSTIWSSFTSDTDLNDWSIKATKDTFILWSLETTNPVARIC